MNAPVVKSAERVFAILEHFRRTQAPAGVTEIARALGLPQSSASMLLRSMANLGYLEYAPRTRVFQPSVRVALLGEGLQKVVPRIGALSTRLQELQRATRETIILGRQNGPNVQYLAVLQQDQGVQLSVKSGVQRPMTLAAVGQVLLAARPDSEIPGIIRRNNADAPSPGFRVGERDFMARVRQIRRQGYAESAPVITAGACVIAMLAPPVAGARPLGIGVGGPADRIRASRDSILDALRTCAAAPDAQPRAGPVRRRALKAA